MSDQNWFDVPEEVKSNLEGSLGDSDAVQLPFSTAFLWVVNGSSKLKVAGGVQYFGGWAASEAEFEEHCRSTGIEVPGALQLTEFSGNEGEYKAYTTRAIGVAPIVYRKRNASEDPNKYREHIQLLGMGVVYQDNTLVPLGPVILTAKGWQTKHIKDAFSAWEKASAEARRGIGLDSKLFYLPVGTFGAEPNFVSVGKGVTSTITPVMPQIPQDITEEVLQARFVGATVALRMSEMRGQAKEWVADWKEEKPQEKAEYVPSFVEADPQEQEIPW